MMRPSIKDLRKVRINKVLRILTAALTLSIGLAACSPFKLINKLSSENNSRISADLSYGAGPRHKLDVYSPLGVKVAAPVVVFFYGGSWNSGSRTDYAFVGRALASRGMVAVLADYRLYPEVRYPAFLEDCAQAVAWTIREVAHYGGDPKHVFVMGHSAGAYNAAMIALDDRWLGAQGMTPSALRGWIGLAGPYDFIPIVNPEVRPVFFYPDTPPESQPINHVTATAPPALLIAAKNDGSVNPQRNTGGLSRQLRARGVFVKELYFGKVSHATLIASLSKPLSQLAPTLDAIEHFVTTDGGRSDLGKISSPQ